MRRISTLAVLGCSLLGGAAAAAPDLDRLVADRLAVERIYHGYRAGSARPAESAVPLRLVRERVRETLLLSVALERFWNTPVTAEALQRELERIARATHFPDRLRAIFAALDHDPRRVREALARPVLVSRLARNFYEGERPWREWWPEASADLQISDLSWPGEGGGELPSLGESSSCAPDDVWENALLSAAPERRYAHTAVWSGSEMIVWGGTNGRFYSNSGQRYDPLTDTWSALSSVHDLDIRRDHSAVWTGSEMIVWGGERGRRNGVTGVRLQDGARYDPLADAWAPVSTSGAPEARSGHGAVWTGEEMIVWGGTDGGGKLATGGRYDPVTDSWTPTSTPGAPSARSGHSTVWSGSELIVWGGDADGGTVADGARYDPAADSWSPLSTTGAPSARLRHTAVWSGTEMIVWGGEINFNGLGDGARYDPATDSWSAVSPTGAPSARRRHTAIWSGSEMIVWGGVGTSSGARYDPLTDSWTPTSSADAPKARGEHAAIWTGSRMIVFGGENLMQSKTGGRYDPAADSWTPTDDRGPGPLWGNDSNYHAWTGAEFVTWGGDDDTSGRYDPLLDAWSPLDTAGAPSSRRGGVSVWTGDELIVWGGRNVFGPTVYYDDGGRYDPLLDAWSPLPAPPAFAARTDAVAVWSGTRMLIWGGRDAGSDYLGDGGMFDPLDGSWRAMSANGAPSPRIAGQPVWTGAEMIVWGGEFNFSDLGDGARYDPLRDRWTPVTAAGAPSPRSAHAAVWNGSEMIVWGASDDADGARYDPAADAWSPVSSVGAPFDDVVTGCWTGSRMVVWGGFGFESQWQYWDSGGRYDPVADAWTPTRLGGAPGKRDGHAVAWIDSHFLVWGGNYGESTDRLNNGGRYRVNVDGDGDGDPDLCDLCPALPGNSPLDGDGDGVGNDCDNCPADPNASQTDQDRDGTGDACDADPDGDGLVGGDDNCPTRRNANQLDLDGDGLGDPCDPDDDGDGVPDGSDNCPRIVNAAQADADGDGVGDPCDVCPNDASNDVDADGVCGGVDNCAVYNPGQADSDGDGIGDLCDGCPGDADPAQEDGDGDGVGDACDCSPSDPAEGIGPPVGGLTLFDDGLTTTLQWQPAATADAYSITRGALDQLAAGSYGPCLAEGVPAATFDDPDVPTAGSGFAYLVQAQDFECGVGSLGYGSDEVERVNGDPAACSGTPVSDVYPFDEETVSGTRSGSLADVTASDDVNESVTEVDTTGGPATRVNLLEHRWAFDVPAGSTIELHVEGHHAPVGDGDSMAFEYSADGANWQPIALVLPASDPDDDQIAGLPGSLSGTVWIRVVDTDRTPPSLGDYDTVVIDEIFIRSVP